MNELIKFGEDGSAQRLHDAHVRLADGYNNFAANIGTRTDNMSSYGAYNFNWITKNRVLLESLYRGSWVIGAAVDMQADDMTQAGIEIVSTMNTAITGEMQEALEELQVHTALNQTIKWSRLYGGSLGVLLIDGQDFSTPLRMDTVGKGQFRGILALDRWQLIPSISHLITELGPNMGKPMYYTMQPNGILPNLGRIHYTRVFRMDAIDLPFFQKMNENLWGESVIERIFDRLEAFDSSSQGSAQLVFKAYLRTLKIKGLRNIISAGGPAAQALERNVGMIRRFQGSEGITLLDQEDEFESYTYNFAGLDDIMMQFGQQLCGALEVPEVRLFGTTPKGMNATGEMDLRNYYDGIKRKQEKNLRIPLKNILRLLHQSLYGTELPSGTTFVFNPLWQMKDSEKSEMASKDTASVVSAFSAGIVTRATALEEMRQQSKTNGVWSNITDQDIADAKKEPPLSEFVQTPEEIAAMNAGTENDPAQEPV